MTLKKPTPKKPQHPKPKNYENYLHDLVDRGEMEEKEKRHWVARAKNKSSKYDIYTP